ncbi:hypothetical protein GPECTOR_47g372 [Gonium pectorale]|uniref:DOMON domain-containing protein n=1 Tax=Gonium pectorale TaxID=33097 RepID=A0A150G960_GONPE|nr:hypothetical protein GPECTOR_47g372 [Gonium pectorale]|eukprot:KXZ46095.1 hypothetical protein GPECTOR_47g372 [Gonium pectorale]
MRPSPGVSSPGAARSGGAARHAFALPAAAALLLVAGALFAGGVSAASCYRSLSRSDFPHCALLSPAYALHWAVRGDNITLGLDADTGGHPDSWLGLALSDAGGMKGADIIVVAGPSDQEGFDDPDGYYATDGGSESDGEAASASSSPPRYVEGPGGWRVIDAHALQFGQPIADMRQDVTLLSAPLSGANHTVAVVARRLKTCDPWDRQIQVGIPQTVSWAYGRGWPSKHLARGDSSVFFVPEADRLWGVPFVPGPAARMPASAIDGMRSAVYSSPNASSASSANGAAAAAAASRTSALPPATGAVGQLAQRLYADRAAADGGGGGAADGGSRGPAATADSKPQQQQEGDEGGRLFASVPVNEPVQEVEVLMPNITIPDNATTNYLCTHVTLPHDRKYHLVGFRALVRSPLIHHIVLIACDRQPQAPARNGDVYECLGMAGGEGCYSSFVGWAPGQMGGALPPSVGLPFGEADSTHFALQVHYNNPEHVSGVVDSSGLRLLYTPKLRPYDAGLLTLGTLAIAIPPGQPGFTLEPNVCPSTCTSRLKTPLRLLASGLHMHALGRSIVTRHIRNGTELPPVGSKRFYSFDYQSLDPVPLDSSILAPGDVLITTCTYDSTTRDNVTRYGEATQDEMCFNSVLYYPKDPDFKTCMAMDAAGDPQVALCAGTNASLAIASALKGPTARQSSNTAGTAAGADLPGAAPQAAMQGGPGTTTNLSALPALAPIFRSGSLVRVPPADTVYEPYGTECPDMSYVPHRA